MTTDERIAALERRAHMGTGAMWFEESKWLLAELKAARAYMAKQPCPEYEGDGSIHDTMLVAFDRQREKRIKPAPGGGMSWP